MLQKHHNCQLLCFGFKGLLKQAPCHVCCRAFNSRLEEQFHGSRDHITVKRLRTIVFWDALRLTLGANLKNDASYLLCICACSNLLDTCASTCSWCSWCINCRATLVLILPERSPLIVQHSHATATSAFAPSHYPGSFCIEVCTGVCHGGCNCVGHGKLPMLRKSIIELSSTVTALGKIPKVPLWVMAALFSRSRSRSIWYLYCRDNLAPASGKPLRDIPGLTPADPPDYCFSPNKYILTVDSVWSSRLAHGPFRTAACVCVRSIYILWYYIYICVYVCMYVFVSYMP